jgi:hypothetical protein
VFQNHTIYSAKNRFALVLDCAVPGVNGPGTSVDPCQKFVCGLPLERLDPTSARAIALAGSTGSQAGHSLRTVSQVGVPNNCLPTS